jgi:DNA invertase Pin-like site-specific DNA recombinase
MTALIETVARAITLVFSYARFSSGQQGMGDSELRQVEATEAWVKRKGPNYQLAPLGIDRGLSGFHGTHRRKGNLGEFLRRVKDGLIPVGSILVVEKITRLSREGARKALKEIVFELLEHGITLQVLSPELTFTAETLENGMMHVLIALLDTAYRESKDKSDYSKRNWQRMRLRAREGGLLTPRLPAWVEIRQGKRRAIPERAEVVRKIFQLAASGHGHNRIIKTLTREGIPAFGERVVQPGRSRSQFSGVWTRPYIASLLNDRRARGEMQPRLNNGDPDGPLLPNYFPEVVTEEEFILARVGAEKRRKKVAYKKGRLAGKTVNAPESRDSRYINVFRGLLRNADDEEGFVLHNKGTAEKPQLYLLSSRGKGGRGPCCTFPYRAFEECILKHIREIKPEELAGKPAGIDPVALAQAKVNHAAAQVEQIKADIDQGGYSRLLADAARDWEAKHAEAKDELQRETQKRASPLDQDLRQAQGLAEAVRTSEDPDGARIKLQTIFARIIDRIWVKIRPVDDGLGCVANVYFREGHSRHYIITYERGRINRPARWETFHVQDMDRNGIPVYPDWTRK